MSNDMLLAHNLSQPMSTLPPDWHQFPYDAVDISTDDVDLTNKSRALGFFVPSVTADYKLYFQYDSKVCDSCDLYLRINGTMVSLKASDR